MTTWQYLIQLVPAGPEQQFPALNELGGQGWELVSAAPTAAVKSRLAGADGPEMALFCIFKRPTNPGLSGPASA